MAGIIILSVFVLAIAGLIAWFFLRKDKKPSQQTEKPSEGDVHETYSPGDPGTDGQEPQGGEGKPQEQEKPSGQDDTPPEEEKPLFGDPMDRRTREMLASFNEYITVHDGSKTYLYLKELLRESKDQRQYRESSHLLPVLYLKELFPVPMDYWGEDGDDASAQMTMDAFLTAMLIAELKPELREPVMKRGYILGGYDRYDNLYGYSFNFDPTVARIVAASIYAAMRGRLKPDIRAMRQEVGGTAYAATLQEVMASDSCDFSAGFYIDLRKILPTAPGPYAPGWEERQEQLILPGEKRDGYGNIEVDRRIHEYIVEHYNLSQADGRQETVQAIADKEGDVRHIFGAPHTAGEYTFDPVFGTHNLGLEIGTDGPAAHLANLCEHIASYAREILQSKDARQYGRLRPGCSWKQEARRNSFDDLRRDVLTCFQIEDADGRPTGYYGEDGRWTEPSKVSSPHDYEEQQRDALWANSYPSGHSAGITGVATMLTELMPGKADVILKGMNRFAMHRCLARYHWTSDTLIGRLTGCIIAPLLRATADYDDLLSQAKDELGIKN
jgi:hypothetical protein